nr:alpha/beta hydrolase [Paenibacillus chinjuensis]
MNMVGFAMHYEERGKGTATATATAIIFIHPPVLTGLTFTYQLEGLSSHYRTIAIDIRGHGQSDPSAEPLTYPLVVEDIKRLMDRLGIEKCFLCGYSTGGSLVLEFLLTYPERAQGGIVVSGMPEVSDKWLRNRILRAIFFSKMGAVGAIALADAWSQTNRLSFLWKLYNDAKKGNPGNVEQYYRSSLTYSCTSRLQAIEHPVLLVYGEKDKHFHPYARMLHQRLPKSELFYVKHADHRIPTKFPEILNDRIGQFITRGGS